MQERCTNTPPSSASAAPQVCDIIYECSSDCEHGSACSLRLAQRGLPRDLEVFMVEGKGFGVRCFHKVCCLSPVWSNTLLHSIALSHPARGYVLSLLGVAPHAARSHSNSSVLMPPGCRP